MAAAPSSDRRTFAALTTIALAAFLLFVGGGSSLAKLDADRAVRLAPWDSELTLVAALRALGEGDEPAARAHALRSLRAMPFNQASLAIVATGLGGTAAVDALNRSAALGWRDPLTNLRLIQASFVEKEPMVAAQRIDALARVTGADIAGRLADALLGMPGGVGALADRAARHGESNWIQDWLAKAPSGPAQAELRRQFLARLDRDEGDWRRAVINASLSGFAAAQLDEFGFEAWRRLLANPARWGDGLYDPTFVEVGRTAASGGEWRINAAPAALPVRVSGGGLTLSYVGADPGQVIAQLTELPPRRFELVARWAGDGAVVGSYKWSIQCHRGAPVALDRNLSADGSGWGDAYLAASPPANCRRAWLSLDLARRPDAEQKVALRSVALRPLP